MNDILQNQSDSDMYSIITTSNLPQKYRAGSTWDKVQDGKGKDSLFRKYGFFDEWGKHFDKNKNIRDKIIQGFMLLKNKVNEMQTGHRSVVDETTGERRFVSDIKMYVPLDLEHMHDGVEKLFDYIAENDIKHSSKIGEKYRGDGIVIRVESIEDAKKIADFVNEDEFLAEGLLPENPFLMSYNGIGITLDGSLSFNNTLSTLIQEYRDEQTKSNEQEKDLNILDFKKWIERKYEEILRGNGIHEIRQKQESWQKPFNGFHGRKTSGPEDEFISYMLIMDYLKISLEPNARFEDFCEFYERSGKTEYATRLYELYNHEQSIDESTDTKQEEFNTEQLTPETLSEIHKDIEKAEETIKDDLERDESINELDEQE